MNQWLTTIGNKVLKTITKTVTTNAKNNYGAKNVNEKWRGKIKCRKTSTARNFWAKMPWDSVLFACVCVCVFLIKCCGSANAPSRCRRDGCPIFLFTERCVYRNLLFFQKIKIVGRRLSKSQSNCMQTLWKRPLPRKSRQPLVTFITWLKRVTSSTILNRAVVNIADWRRSACPTPGRRMPPKSHPQEESVVSDPSLFCCLLREINKVQFDQNVFIFISTTAPRRVVFFLNWLIY